MNKEPDPGEFPPLRDEREVGTEGLSAVDMSVTTEHVTVQGVARGRSIGPKPIHRLSAVDTRLGATIVEVEEEESPPLMDGSDAEPRQVPAEPEGEESSYAARTHGVDSTEPPMPVEDKDNLSRDMSALLEEEGVRPSSVDRQDPDGEQRPLDAGTPRPKSTRTVSKAELLSASRLSPITSGLLPTSMDVKRLAKRNRSAELGNHAHRGESTEGRGGTPSFSVDEKWGSVPKPNARDISVPKTENGGDGNQPKGPEEFKLTPNVGCDRERTPDQRRKGSEEELFQSPLENIEEKMGASFTQDYAALFSAAEPPPLPKAKSNDCFHAVMDDNGNPMYLNDEEYEKWCKEREQSESREEEANGTCRDEYMEDGDFEQEQFQDDPEPTRVEDETMGEEDDEATWYNEAAII